MNVTRERSKARNIRVVAYCRVSTDNADQKQSFEAQQAYYTHKFKEKGYTVAPVGLLHRKKGADEVIEGIYADEGISATSTKNRVAFLKMIEDAKNGLFDMIFVKSVSRFARNTVDGLTFCEELRKYNVAVMFEDYNVCSISEDKDFELSLFFSLAQKESQTKSYNVKWGIRRSQQEGTWVTQASFGYTKVGRDLVINETEAEVVREIFRIYLDEGWGFGKIASYLQENGVRTKRGAKWSMRRITEILSNPVYRGSLRVHTIENRTIKDKSDKIQIPVEDQIVNQREDLRIISDEIWDRVQYQKSLKSAEMGSGHRPSRKYKYSSFLYCFNCGGAYRAKRVWRHSQKPIKYDEAIPMEYSCSTRDAYKKGVLCKTERRIAIRESRLDAIFSEQIRNIQASKEYLEMLFQFYEIVTRGFPKAEEEIKAMYQRRDDINSELRVVLKRSMEKDTNVYDDILNELEDELWKFNAEISKQETREIAIKQDYERYLAYIKMIDELDPDNISRIELQEVFRRVNVIAMEQDLNWKSPATGLVFEYNFIDMPQFEIYERALSMGCPLPLEMEIIFI